MIKAITHRHLYYCTVPMKLVDKFLSEITIKSKPVRRCVVGQLHENLKLVLKDIAPPSPGCSGSKVETGEPSFEDLCAMCTIMRAFSGH